MEATALNRSDAESVHDTLPIGVMALTRDRRVAIWNRQMERWSGVPRAGILGRMLGEAFPGFDDAVLSQRLSAVFDCGTPIELAGPSLALPLLLPDGRVRPQQVAVAPMLAANGAAWALFAIQDVSDLTEQIQALHGSAEESVLAASRAEVAMRLTEQRNERLIALNQDLEQFAYLASHDLQEPLRTLTSFSTFLQSDLGDDLPEAAARDLGHIVAASARMRRLIDGLLALSRVSRSEMSWSPTSLRDCVAEALESLEATVAERQPTIVGVGGLPTVRGDRRLLTQVFRSLLSNAMKFTDASRPCVIDVSAERDGAGWLVKTKDNGIGIAEQYLTKVFAPFQRLHSADKYPGSGMGLAICKRAVERHGGAVWALPNETVGACFQFTLPDRRDQS